jgi:hypothetical protein
MVQFVAANSSARYGLPGSSFFGTNFAISGTLGGGVEMALIGQRGVGDLAPQRLSAIATMRPISNHQVTASIGYGQVALARKSLPEFDLPDTPGLPISVAKPSPLNAVSNSSMPRSLDQVSIPL